MENRRLLFAALLSVLILIGWNYLLVTLRPPEDPANLSTLDDGVAPRETGSPRDSDSPRDSGLPRDSGSEKPASGPLLPELGEPAPGADDPLAAIDFGADVVAASEESRAVLETDEFRAEFTNLGAQLVSLQLKKHADPAGEPLEMVLARGTDPYPFAMVVGGDRSHPLNKALFEWTEETDDEGFPLLRFRHSSERGAAEKVIRRSANGLLEVTVTVSGRDEWGVLLGPGVRRLEEGEEGNRLLARQAAWRRGDESETIQPDDPDGDVYVPASGLDWIALEDNFFLNAALPQSGVRDVVIRPIVKRAEAREGEPRFLPVDSALDEEGATEELMVLLQSSGSRMEFSTYFGAKNYGRLSALPRGLKETVRWGSFIGIFARPLYFALDWIHANMVPNYGWAIILVTCLIKLLFFPLTYKSQASMAKMQELNPKVQAIRAKYRSKLKDRQGRPNAEAQRALNDEIMKVYKSAGVNPASGCFPILLQMPVFFALFRLLSTTVELRGAPWHLWIQDLSAKDPYFVLPLLMGATSIATQKMMPQSGEPMQRRMMQMMPIMFTIFALAFPSGLVLYWVTNNLLTMVQQWVMLKLKSRKEAAGGGQTAKSEA